MDRNILCNCDIEAKSNFLLESLEACGEQENENSDLEMYFTVNLAFANYLDQLEETIDVPIERNWMHQMHVLPISIEPFQMTFNTFLSSYMVDVILFVTGILIVILTFIIMYMFM